VTLTLTVWPHVSAAAGAVFNFSFHCRTSFSLLDKKAVHSVGQHCRLNLLQFKKTTAHRGWCCRLNLCHVWCVEWP
jgi:hypothetical protein